MSLPRPIRPYHFQADLIWWDGPFKSHMVVKRSPGCYNGVFLLIIHICTVYVMKRPDSVQIVRQDHPFSIKSLFPFQSTRWGTCRSKAPSTARAAPCNHAPLVGRADAAHGDGPQFSLYKGPVGGLPAGGEPEFVHLSVGHTRGDFTEFALLLWLTALHCESELEFYSLLGKAKTKTFLI